MTWKSVQPLAVIFLLILMVATQIFTVVDQVQARQACETALEKSGELLKIQQETYLNLMSNYEKAAYGNVGVDRIAEQQLIAAESQLAALQVLASQNAVLIDLLSGCR